MSIANGTEHYDYPQVQLTDRPTFADYNPTFRDIDAKLYSLITGATADEADIAQLKLDMTQAQSDIVTAKGVADAAKAEADANAENIGIISTALGNTDRTVATKLDSVAIAEPYDTTATYSVGDVVVYNGQRYVCSTAVTVAEPFDADKWTGEDVETVLDSLKSDVDDVKSDLANIGQIVWSGAVNAEGDTNADCSNYTLFLVTFNALGTSVHYTQIVAKNVLTGLNAINQDATDKVNFNSRAILIQNTKFSLTAGAFAKVDPATQGTFEGCVVTEIRGIV